MRILAGIETEYGFYVHGEGVERQIDHSAALVRSLSYGRPSFWDYRYETPRADLRGFTVDSLAIDPEDAQFDEGGSPRWDADTRSDRVLSNGARFYNDHGHPEYATPECFSLDALVAHDQGGELVALDAKRAFEEETGLEVSLYKNNTDFHGATYGTHESYSMPRNMGAETLFRVLMPTLICRTLLCGAGKVGSELKGSPIPYQLSQRADFLTEAFSVDTLYRRPVFNTRDEPHADANEYVRVHVICGDATLLSSCTKLKAGLVKLALFAGLNGVVPEYLVSQPARAFQTVSRDLTGKEQFQTDAGKLCAREYLEWLCKRAESLDLDEDLSWTLNQTQNLLHALDADFDTFAYHVDWACKKKVLEQLEIPFDDPSMQSYDLAFSDLDFEFGLAHAAKEMGIAVPDMDRELLVKANKEALEPTRARARGLATSYPELKKASWRMLTFLIQDRFVNVELNPMRDYSNLREGLSVESFIQACLSTN